MFKNRVIAALGLLVLGGIHQAPAQIPVTDIGAIVQLVQQVSYWQQQIQAMSSQLDQLQSTYGAMTGNRGMQTLLPLSAQARNYLPSTWSQLGTVSGLQAAVNANAVLTPQQVAALSPAEQAQLAAARRSPAMLQAITQQALVTTSSRFASIQQLIDAIPRATDQKGVLDLHARIAAEQGMLQNENTKLSVLFGAAQAQEWTQRQRISEQAVADVGSLRSLPPLRLP